MRDRSSRGQHAPGLRFTPPRLQALRTSPLRRIARRSNFFTPIKQTGKDQNAGVAHPSVVQTRMDRRFGNRHGGSGSRPPHGRSTRETLLSAWMPWRTSRALRWRLDGIKMWVLPAKVLVPPSPKREGHRHVPLAVHLVGFAIHRPRDRGWRGPRIGASAARAIAS
jgi:hypothetical protein